MHTGAKPEHLVLVGTTASSKSALALEIARRAGTIELVSCDSMQVYRGMDIGTAKPSPKERAEIRHHLIDVVDASDEYGVSSFADDVRTAVQGIENRGMRALLVGGTGLYARAAIGDLEIPAQFLETRAELAAVSDTEELHRRLRELDPIAADRMEPTNRRRVLRALEVTVGSGRPFSSYGPGMTAYPSTPFHIAGIRLTREIVDLRIEARYRDQIAAGFVEEVRSLMARPGGMSVTARQALGYRELLAHLNGECTLDEALEVAIARTRRFARRQERWFRRDPRITWFEPSPGNEPNPMDLLPRLLKDFSIP